MELKEDLGVKIGTKREAWWTDIKNKCEASILNAEGSLEMDKSVLELANKIIAEEQAK